MNRWASEILAATWPLHSTIHSQDWLQLVAQTNM